MAGLPADGHRAPRGAQGQAAQKVIYFAANLVTWVDKEKRHQDLPSLENEMAEEIADIEKRRDLDIDRRYKALEDELKALEAEGA